MIFRKPQKHIAAISLKMYGTVIENVKDFKMKVALEIAAFHWPSYALAKVIFNLYIYNIHDKLLF